MATENTQMIIDNVDALQVRMKEMRKAQQVFATYTQEQVDKKMCIRDSSRILSSCGSRSPVCGTSAAEKEKKRMTQDKASKAASSEQPATSIGF